MESESFARRKKWISARRRRQWLRRRRRPQVRPTGLRSNDPARRKSIRLRTEVSRTRDPGLLQARHRHPGRRTSGLERSWDFLRFLKIECVDQDHAGVGARNYTSVFCELALLTC